MSQRHSFRILGISLTVCALAACSTRGPYRYGAPTRNLISARDVERDATPFIELSKPSATPGAVSVRLAEQPLCVTEQTLYDDITLETTHEFDWAYVKFPVLLLSLAGTIGGVAQGDISSATNIAMWGSGSALLFVALALPNDSSYSHEYSTTQSEPYTELGREIYACGEARAYAGTARAVDVHVSSGREGEQGFDFRLPVKEQLEFLPADLQSSFAYWAKTCEVSSARAELSSKQVKKSVTIQLTFPSLSAKVERSGRLEAALKLGDQCLERRRLRFATKCWETARGKHGAGCENTCIQSKGGDLCAFDKADCTSLGRSASDCSEIYERCLDKLGMGAQVRKQCVDKCVSTELGTRCDDEWKVASPVTPSAKSTLSALPAPSP